MNDKAKCIEWSRSDDEPASVYHLMSEDDAIRFFRDLDDNAETDGREKFRIVELTAAEWQAARTRGDAEA